MKTLFLAAAITLTLGACSGGPNRVHSTAAIGAVGGYPVGAYAGREGTGAAGDYLLQQHRR